MVIFGAVDKSGMGQPPEYCDLWPLVECKQHCTKYSYKGSQEFRLSSGFPKFQSLRPICSLSLETSVKNAWSEKMCLNKRLEKES